MKRLTKSFGMALVATFLLWLPALGQAPKPTPAAKTERQITLVATRPGAYAYWTVGKSGQSGIASLTASQPSTLLPLPADVGQVCVLDEATGLLAIVPIARVVQGTLRVAPNDFQWIRTVAVRVTDAGGNLVEMAAVTLTTPGGKPRRRVITAVDRGVTYFENVPIGPASLLVSAGEKGAETTQKTTIAARPGQGPFAIDVRLSGAVPTLMATPAPLGTLPPSTPGGVTIVERGRDEPRNELISGWVGLALLLACGYFGWRHLQSRGITTLSIALERMGIELPTSAPSSPATGLKPTAPPPSPLPSLAELPPPEAIPPAAALSFGTAPSSAPPAGPRLVSLSGPAAGRVFGLLGREEPFTVGREPANTLELGQDTTVSRRHARFEPLAEAWQVIDEGSSNGTFVNGERVEGCQTLAPGDEVWIGTTRLRFEV